MNIRIQNEGRQGQVSLQEDVKVEKVLNEIVTLLVVAGFSVNDIKRAIIDKAIELDPKLITETVTNTQQTSQQEKK